ncbi:MAG: bifunctional 5,10-methylenetetrahydrofolate dehydrogenase/5,10-methenyltetrahydrofolate cyclohydrolase [Acidimicrobiia bacterium]
MTAQFLDGESCAARVKEDLAIRVQKLKDEHGITPGLGTILVGDDGPSGRYVGRKHAACEAVGMTSVHEHLPQSSTTADVLAAVTKFNADPTVHGYIVQLPLPAQCDEAAVLEAIDPEKDADGLHPVNLGKLVMNVEAPLPCTPAGIQRLLAESGVEVSGKHVVIVGRGLTVGRPLSLLLSVKGPGANAAVTVVHTGVPNLADYTRQADVLIAGAGAPGMITKDHVKPGAAVVSAGQKIIDGKVAPDVREDVAEVAGWITPRIGGVGPMTVAMLLANTVAAAERAALTR